jgi:hypothetical protein
LLPQYMHVVELLEKNNIIIRDSRILTEQVRNYYK